MVEIECQRHELRRAAAGGLEVPSRPGWSPWGPESHSTLSVPLIASRRIRSPRPESRVGFSDTYVLYRSAAPACQDTIPNGYLSDRLSVAEKKTEWIPAGAPSGP